MSRSTKLAALAGALLAVATPVGAQAVTGPAWCCGPNPSPFPPYPSRPAPLSYPAGPAGPPSAVQLCLKGGAGKLLMSGPQFFQTKPLQGYHNGHLGQNGGPNTPATITQDCDSVSVDGTGPHTFTAEKYLKAPCYRTVNGDLVNPPTLVSTGAMCSAKVDGIDVQVGQQPTAHLAADSVELPVPRGQTTTVTFDVSDVRYFPCVSESGPGTTNPNDDNKVCEPTGSTRS
jgi:hypothetical protein